MYEELICPITHQYFRNPTTLSDGYTYEYECIDKWLKKNNFSSPMTRQKINGKLSVNLSIKKKLDDLEKFNTNIKKQRYKNYTITHKSYKKFNYDISDLPSSPEIPFFDSNIQRGICVYVSKK